MAASSDVNDDVNLDTVPALALNVSSRMKLSWYLTPEQPLLCNQGLARDYRGLAEQMGYQYHDIKHLQRSEDPTLKLLETWTATPNSTIGLLISYLTNMERYDVIEDIIEQFKNDAISYINARRTLPERPTQVSEVTSCQQSTSQGEGERIVNVTNIHIQGAVSPVSMLVDVVRKAALSFWNDDY